MQLAYGGAVQTTPDSPEEAVMMLAMQVGRQLRTRHPGDQLDAATWAVVHTLSCHGDMRLSDLAARLQLDASTVSRHIKQLEDRGLVERADDPDDRRAARVCASPAGLQALAQGRQRRREQLARVLADWSEADRAALYSIATRFVDDLTRTLDPDETR